MGNSLGESTIFTVTGGRSIQVTADGAPKFKAGGVTINWDYVPAVTVDTTYEDNVVVEAGKKALRYGSVVYRLADGRFGLARANTTLKRGETFIVNETWLEEDRMSNHPGVIDGGRVFKDRILAGGAETNEVQQLTVTATGGTFTVTVDGQTTGAVAYNAAAGTLQTALEALSNVDTGDITVTKVSADFVLTYGGKFSGVNVPAVTVNDDLATGGKVTSSTTTPGAFGGPTFANLEAVMN